MKTNDEKAARSEAEEEIERLEQQIEDIKEEAASEVQRLQQAAQEQAD